MIAWSKAVCYCGLRGAARDCEPLTPRTSGDTGLVTEQAPTPVFRRFPWIQLVFCLACLAMTAWTWMRYSYAPHFEDVSTAPVERAGIIFDWWRPALIDRYVVARLTQRSEWCEDDGSYTISKVGDESVTIESTLPPGTPTPAPDEEIVLVGRVIIVFNRICKNGLVEQSGPRLVLDITASRFHPASIAGLVVGAMGCFIFGLYLRGWLRERKALASEPPGDMIA